MTSVEAEQDEGTQEVVPTVPAVEEAAQEQPIKQQSGGSNSNGEGFASSSSGQNSNNDTNKCCSSFSQNWTNMIHSFEKPIHRVLVTISHHAAMYPKVYVVSIICFSIAMMGIGLFTNFKMEAAGDVWTPQDTRSVKHGDWIEDQSGYPQNPRYAMLIVHRNGKNMLGDDGELARESVSRAFQAIDAVRTLPGYDELCIHRDYVHPVTNQSTCDIIGVTSFWNDNLTFFDETNQEDVIHVMSSKTFPSGRGVDFDQIIGYNECDNDEIECLEGGTLTSGLSYVTLLGLPGLEEVEDETEDFEEDAIDSLKSLRSAWENEKGNDFRLELLLARSFDDEMLRAISADFPLLPVVFLLMTVLCIGIYSRRDPVFSRAWLGFGAVITVLLAIMASFGLLFTLGVPFTNLTPILPFIMFGIGLDNSFIIAGAYTRTDHTKPQVDRISETLQDIGGTILLTTLTSSTAFALGLVSSIPAVQWLVLYAFPTILIGFVYQITFFVALISLDERRIHDNRRDCCFCCRDQTPGSQAFHIEQDRLPGKHFADRAMIAYGNFLLKPVTKGFVVVAFAAMLGVFTYSTTQLDQYFSFTEILPSDSYIQGWWDVFNELNENHGVSAGIYFRDVDFSQNATREAMYDYVQELVDMPYAGKYPTFNFWLLDFDKFVAEKNMTGLSFNEQLHNFLQVDIYDRYKDEMVLDDEGNMLTSRTVLAYNNHDYESITDTVDALELQESISAKQPINQGRKKWAFFTWAEDYYIWEFYKVSPEELILSTLLGTASVSFLALLFIPHWSAVFTVFFMLSVLYIDLMGFIQFCGIRVGPVMYISMVMSIGLMVDYVMHVTYRYMEVKANNREEKTKLTLETIGASVLVGGISTLIGVLPLGFASSEIFFTVFVVFFGLVLLGLLHGLVLLPVLLSILGPECSVENGLEPEASETKTFDDLDQAGSHANN